MISVIIPVYNAASCLCRCLDSVLNSTHRELELILVNDGSTDGSAVICEEYAARDSRIVLLSQENLGVSAARNLGLKTCHGKWVVFVDADDRISPDFLETVDRAEYQDQDMLLFDFVRTEEKLTAALLTPEVRLFGPENILELFQSLLLRQPIENGNLNLRNKGNFLCFAHNPIQEPCGSSFRFSGRVGINVHCGTDIRVSEKFLHIFGLCTA